MLQFKGKCCSKPWRARKPSHNSGSLSVAIGITLLIAIILFILPEQIIDKNPNTLIPPLVALAASSIFDSYQKEQVNIHKENNRTLLILLFVQD